jgi:hypothetical protein
MTLSVRYHIEVSFAVAGQEEVQLSFDFSATDDQQEVDDPGVVICGNLALSEDQQERVVNLAIKFTQDIGDVIFTVPD